MLVTGDQQLLKQINRMALVRQLCSEPGLSRAALAEAVGLTKSTVSLLVRELMDEGWFSESELVSTGVVGRRATPLRLDQRRLALLGADLGVEEGRIVATDLVGNVLEVRVIPYIDARDAASCVRLVAEGLLRLAESSSVGTRRVLGIGIGLYGVVDDVTGILHYAPHLGWRDIDVGAMMARLFAGERLQAVPLFIQNDANVAALGEFEFTGRSGADPLIYLSIGHGVGAGVIVSDGLLRGSRGFAGEVGHSILLAGGPLCSCGRRGCADALIGFDALLGAEGSRPARPSIAALAYLRAQLDAGDGATATSVDTAGRYLGVLLNNLWVAFDPMVIILGGSAMRLGNAFIEPARRVLREYADAAMLPTPALRAAHFDADAVAMGGAAMVRHYLTRPFNDPGWRRRTQAEPAFRLKPGAPAHGLVPNQQGR